MKKNTSFRISEELCNALQDFANANNMTRSQLIELACYNFLEIKNKNEVKKLSDTEKKEKIMRVTFKVTNKTFNKLVEEVRRKNVTLSQEVRYRLTATLDQSIIDPNITDDLMMLWFDLNRLGNLFKLALANHLIDNDLGNDIRQKIIEIGEEVVSLKVANEKKIF